MAALSQFAIRDHKTHRLLKPPVKFQANSVALLLGLIQTSGEFGVSESETGVY